MSLLVDQPEAGFLIEVSRRAQHAVGPQRELPVARLPGVAHALPHEPGANAEPARLRLDQQQAQLGHRPRMRDEEYRADRLAGPLRGSSGATNPRRAARRSPRGAAKSSARYSSSPNLP